MFDDRMFNMKSMTGAIRGAETVHSSGSTEFRLNSEAPVAQSLVFCVLFCRTLYFFLFGIVSGVIVVLSKPSAYFQTTNRKRSITSYDAFNRNMASFIKSGEIIAKPSRTNVA